ncbi:ankyrin [Penicillium subrubescens]|uniref:ankyrin n=1 Tax=Penicillium subrubescens TaxID=1316194 RepID=UPI002544E8CF|nr:ankyrin [Penicillium subrubescens]KAJ5892177.1 ankyrin [Penicillium subrubescens]
MSVHTSESMMSSDDDKMLQRTNSSDAFRSNHDDSFCYRLQAEILKASPYSGIGECVPNPGGSHHPHLEDVLGRTCLHYAAQTKELHRAFGNEEAVGDFWAELLEHFGDKLTACDNEGRTALSWAAEAGNSSAISNLLGSFKQPDHTHLFYDDKDKKGNTPLFYLLQFRKDQPRRDGKRPTNDYDVSAIAEKENWLVGRLIWEIEWHSWSGFVSEHLEESFLSQGPLPPHYFGKEVLNKRFNGQTLLSRAVEFKDYSFVHVLSLVDGIDVTKVDVDENGVKGKSPLLHAIDNGDKDMVKLLKWNALRGPEKDLSTLLDSFIDKSKNESKESVERLESLLDLQALREVGDLEEEGVVTEDIEIGRQEEEDPTRAYLVKVLRCSWKLKALPMVQFLLENGASPRPLQLTKKAWFEFIDSNPHLEDKSRLRKFLQLTEVVREGNTLHILRTPETIPETIREHVRGDKRSQMSVKACQEVEFARSRNQYGFHEVKLHDDEVVCKMLIRFPNETDIFTKQGRSLEEMEDPKCTTRWIQWTTSRNGFVCYESTLSSGQIPGSSYAFVKDLISDIEDGWMQIFNTAEDRLNTNTTDYQRRDQSRELVRYFATERKFFAILRQALRQHLGSTLRLIKESHSKTQELLEKEDIEDPNEVTAALENARRLLNEHLERQIQDIRDSVQVELAEISVGETIFMRRIGLVTSLFGMNVNALQNNPDWKWYLLFCAGLLMFTYALWVVSDPESQATGIECGRNFMWTPSTEKSAMGSLITPNFS